MTSPKKEVTLVSRNACPMCVLVKGELSKHMDSITLKCLKNTDADGKAIIEKSGLHSAPIIVCDGKFYSGKDALAFAMKSLEAGDEQTV